ncbi:MAG: hypothetical protein ACD_52C00161G0004 [uncultured bacterium]|nr:MAG: hypothetical protein ACD_52C00161G0004 [uncultured bacterium]
MYLSRGSSLVNLTDPCPFRWGFWFVPTRWLTEDFGDQTTRSGVKELIDGYEDKDREDPVVILSFLN